MNYQLPCEASRAHTKYCVDQPKRGQGEGKASSIYPPCLMFVPIERGNWRRLAVSGWSRDPLCSIKGNRYGAQQTTGAETAHDPYPRRAWDPSGQGLESMVARDGDARPIYVQRGCCHLLGSDRRVEWLQSTNTSPPASIPPSPCFSSKF